MDEVREWPLLGRVGTPQDCANLVKFLCSEEGGWINAQLLRSFLCASSTRVLRTFS